MNYFETNGKRKGQLRRNFSNEEFTIICSLTTFIKDITRKSLRERLYCIINNIKEIPTCSQCNNCVNFNGKYHRNCSKQCSDKDITKIVKAKQTKLERYNNENYNNQSKHKSTCLKRYNVEHTSKLKENRIKCKQTKLERYDNENYNNIEQIKLTCSKKYNVDNVSKTIEMRNRLSIIKSTNFLNRKTEEGISGYVYILQFNDLIKIGVTNSIKTRFKQLKKDFRKFNIIKITFSNNCYKQESELHKKYKQYRICLKSGNGRTEFFNINNFNEFS